MKINENFLLKKVAGEYIIAPLNEKYVDINSMLTVNETGGFLWESILKGADTIEKLAQALVNEYDVSYEECIKDVEEYVSTLKKKGIILDD